MFRQKFLIIACFLIIAITGIAYAQNILPLEEIRMPPGFKIEIYAENVPNARSLAISDDGTVFVGTRTAGNVYALLDIDHDYKVDEIIVLAKGLRAPNGVAFKDGDLYFAEVSRVWRFENIEKHLHVKPKANLITDQLPADAHHGWKFIKFGPDGLLYIPVGAPCNVCEREDLRYASILTMNQDGSELKIFARGVRNTVGFDWHPQTQELWFTDNGRDWLGDDFPPDELNHAPQVGLHFGFPYCHGKNLPDPEHGKYSCSQFRAAAQELGPHVAALGMRFYTGKMFSEEYKNQIFIAEHGSWNRSSPLGYRITLVKLEKNLPVSYEVFAEGWLKEGKPWGRPVDILVMPDGSLLISDDYANVIYRITYQK